MITEEQFREIEARWRNAFAPAYDARAEPEDWDMRVNLTVFKDGVKLWERREILARPLTDSGAVENLADGAKKELPPTTNTE